MPATTHPAYRVNLTENAGKSASHREGASRGLCARVSVSLVTSVVVEAVQADQDIGHRSEPIRPIEI